MSEFRRYGTDPKLDAWVDSDNWKDREEAADQEYALDILINDEDYRVREAVANQEYGLEKLINDEDYRVRKLIVEMGYGLDILVNDEDADIRAEVARQGYGLNKLINDPDWWVRKTVAEQGYGLDKLINDRYKDVRKAVAEQGYGLNDLINDEDYDVRAKVSDYLKEHGYRSIAEWTRVNPDRVYDPYTQNCKVQEDLKDFIYKIDDSSKLKIEYSYDSIDEFFDDYSSSSDDSDELIICTADTKIPIIKIQKAIKENKTDFKFLVDINKEDGDSFTVKTTIKSKEQLNSKIQETVEALRLYQEFNKYADDLEDCL